MGPNQYKVGNEQDWSKVEADLIPEVRAPLSSSAERLSSVFGFEAVKRAIGRGGIVEGVKGGLGKSDGFTKGFLRFRFALRTICLYFSSFLER